MSTTVNASVQSQCAISLTPQETKHVLSKMKVPTIPNIAVNALNIINHASYAHLTTSSK